MKKKYVVMFSVLLILSVVIYICIPKTKEKVSDSVDETPKASTSGFLTLMLEQDDGSYQKSSSNSWPGNGYSFNSELSSCERGGELVYDRETNIVKLISSGSDKCYVYFDKYINPVVNSVSVTGTTTSSISISVSASGGTNTVATYYYSINNGAYTSSTSNTKTFTGLSKGTTYSIKVYVKDINGVDSSVKTISAETESIVLLADYIKGLYTSQGVNGLYYHTSSLANSAADNSYRYAGGDYKLSSFAINSGYDSIATTQNTSNGVINFYCNGTKRYFGYYCSSSYTRYFTTAYNENLHYDNYFDAIKAAISNGYLTKDNIKNFVCFGTDANVCPDDNLYRIIGVFNGNVKLIKYNFATSEVLGNNTEESWGRYVDYMDQLNVSYNYIGTTSLNSISGYYLTMDTSAHENFGSNNWTLSDFYKINLNINFLNYLGSNWNSKILNTQWKLGGSSNSNITASDFYKNENGAVGGGASPNTTSVTNKIGMMYVSDYGFAANPEYWTTYMSSYNNNVPLENWLYMGLSEWTMDPNSSNVYSVYYIYDFRGYISNTPVLNALAVRPTFYLNSNILYVSGSGTSSDPIRIN